MGAKKAPNHQISSFWRPLGEIWGPFWEHFGDLFGTFWGSGTHLEAYSLQKGECLSWSRFGDGKIAFSFEKVVNFDVFEILS